MTLGHADFERAASRPRTGAFGATLVFLHLPKTAGTTFREVLLTHHSLSTRLIERGHPELLTMLEDDGDAVRKLVARHDALTGHLIFERRVFEGAGPTIFAALLREPVARAVSHFRHIRRTPAHPLHEALAQASLAEAMRHERFAKQVTNNQLRSLCRAQSLDAFEAIAAKHRFILGRQDRFEAFLSYLEATFGLALPRVPQRNVAPVGEAEALTAEARAALEAANEVDRALFERIEPVVDSGAG